jgi:hypothetical protein
MAVEILEIMDECVVALEAARLLRSAKEKAESRLSSETTSIYNQEPMHNTVPEVDPVFTRVEGHSTQLNHYWGPLGLMNGGEMDFDITTQLGAFDQLNSMFFSLGER